MSHRRPDPHQAGLERALRHALRLAADSVEPGADGLERIRAKIATGQPAPGTGWWTTPLARLVAVATLVWRYVEPAVIWVRYCVGAVAERFRPQSAVAGWLGWLRPVAGVATALLVVLGASWAITALPRVIAPTGHTDFFGGTSQSSSAGQSHTGHSSSYNQGPPPAGRTRSSSHHMKVSCRTSSPSPHASASVSPTQQPSSTPISPAPTSSSPSPSPSPSSTSPTSTPAPGTSSPAPVSTASAASAQAAEPGSGSLIMAQQTASSPGPQLSAYTSTATTKPSPHGTRSPCR